KEGIILPVKDARMYVQSEGFDNQGSMYYKAPNPEYGATFTYYIKEVPKTAKALREEKEKELFKKGDPIPQPSVEQLNEENREIKPYLIFTITDNNGNVVKNVYKSASKGINRVTWDFSYESIFPVTTNKFDPVPSGGRRGGGIMAMPGQYNVSMSMYAKGNITRLTEPQPFTCKPLNLATFTAKDIDSKYGWMKEAMELSRTIYGTLSYTNELRDKVNAAMQAIHQTPSASSELMKEAERINREIEDILFKFNGPTPKASREEIPPVEMPLSERLGEVAAGTYGTTGDIPVIAKEQMDILKSEFPAVLERVRKAGSDLKELDKKLDQVKAPWTPGRVPVL
ncbi:MAG: hypothetical protein HZB98_02740, partial [Bacteroidia bacterium]|nr:hypothetical protein [Bacteroidia bacterium]